MKTYQKYYEGREQLLEELELLHQKKQELKEAINQLGGDIKPFVAELSGLPRTGKTSSMERIYEFFRYGEIPIVKTGEPAFFLKHTLSKEELKSLSNVEFNDKTLEISRKLLKEAQEQNPSIILMDRGVMDNYFWYQMMYQEGKITEEILKEKLNKIGEDLSSIDQLYVMTANPEIIIKRDYMTEIFLEERKKTNLTGVQNLTQGFGNLLPEIKKNNKESEIIEIDTTNMEELETSIVIANKLIDGVSKKMIKK